MKFHFPVIVVTLIKVLEITASDPLVIKTVNGKVRGITLKSSTNKDVNAWYGIPFAKPPIGKLRFQRPIPANAWTGVLETTTKPNSCLQLPNFAPTSILSEDCLYLNVVAPRKFKGKLKVMVWIYGGGFFQGSSTLPIYDLKNLVAEENVIAVSFQYRISSLGFLYLGIPEALGNVGLFDQLLALEWVQENIINFGGDPECVTLFGESAGAASIGFHLMSPLSKSLFSRAILESGVPTASWALTSHKISLQRAFYLAESLNCSHDSSKLPEMVECLKKIDGKLLIEKEWKIPISIGDYYPFYPVVDGTFLTDTPKNLLSSRKFRDKNILIGYNSVEVGLIFVITFATQFPDMSNIFLTKPVMTQMVNSILESRFNQDAINAIILEYTKSITDPDTNYREAFLRLGSDYYFNCPINEWAHKFSEDGSTVYKYVFTHRSSNSPFPVWVNATHEEEIPYVFGQTFNSTYGFTGDERTLTTKIVRYWTNFAKTGNPNVGDEEVQCLVKWPRYKPKGQKYLEISLNDLEVGRGPIIPECKNWEKYIWTCTHQ